VRKKSVVHCGAIHAEAGQRALCDLDDPETLDLLDNRGSLPALDIVQDDEVRQLAPHRIMHLVDGLQLFPHAADCIVERNVDAVALVAGELAARVDAVAGDDAPPGGRIDEDELLADRVPAAETRMDAGQRVVLVAVDQRQRKVVFQPTLVVGDSCAPVRKRG
jgi:hypothetical protein